MDIFYIAVAVAFCLFLHVHAVNAQGAISNVAVEAWVSIWVIVGLIGGVIIIVIGLVWVVFCIVLYRHHKEHQSDEDSNKEEMKDTQLKKKLKERREERNQQTGIELAVQSRGGHDLWHSRLLEHQKAADPPQAPRPMSPHAQHPQVPGAAQHADSEVTNTAETTNINPTSSALSPPSPKSSVPSTLESLFTPQTLSADGGGHSHGRKLHVQLSNVSSSRLRRLSDVEECEVQPEVSNYPLRYGQRRPSDASRKTSSDNDPFAYFNFEPLLLGRSPLEKRDTHGGQLKVERHSRNYQDHAFGQLSSWPEFN